MEKLLKTYALAETGEIYFSARRSCTACRLILKRRSLRRLTEEGRKPGSEERTESNSRMVSFWSMEAWKKIVRLKALFDAKKDELQDKVNEILFL